MSLSLGHHFVPSIIYKGGQATKPIIVVKISYELIQVKGFSMKSFTFLALARLSLLITCYNAASDLTLF